MLAGWRLAIGFRLYPGHLDLDVQRALVLAVLNGEKRAPFYRPITPGGQAMSVEMTNLGALGWVTDAGGYRYEPRHPTTRRALAADPAAAPRAMGRSGRRRERRPTPAWSISTAAAPAWAFTRIATKPISPSRAVGFAGRHGDLSHRRNRSPRADAVTAPRLGRCLRPHRRGAVGFSRRRSHPCRLLAPHSRRRADQPHPAARPPRLTGDFDKAGAAGR